MAYRKNITPEQKAAAEAKRAKFRALVKQVAAMSDSERQAILERVGAVVTCEGRALSASNTMLCLMQLPGVSMVGGFKQWIRQGRCVAKGQHGISIWIHCDGKKAEDGEEEGKDYFTSGTVKEISKMTTQQAADFVDVQFPNRHKLKIDWLQFERDIRRTLTMDMSYEDRLMVIDILLCEHTGRGTELAPR